jgi:hypothetical protein
MKDVRGEYFKGLEESERAREHWRGIDPDDGRTEWLFQTVEDDGQRIAIRQMIIHADGGIDRYWWKHLGDDAGFLTDQPVDYANQLVAIPAEEFDGLWGGSSG